MKKVIFNNGVKVELAYHTSEVKFDKKYTANRKLSFSVKEGDEVRTREFDLDDYRSVYGGIEGNVQWLSIWEILGDEFACSVDAKEFEQILNAIRSFEIQLTDGTNSEFADELNEMFAFNGGYEE